MAFHQEFLRPSHIQEGSHPNLLSLEEYEAILEELEDARDARIIAERRLDRGDTISLEAFAEELKREGRISGWSSKIDDETRVWLDADLGGFIGII